MLKGLVEFAVPKLWSKTRNRLGYGLQEITNIVLYVLAHSASCQVDIIVLFEEKKKK